MKFPWAWHCTVICVLCTIKPSITHAALRITEVTSDSHSLTALPADAGGGTPVRIPDAARDLRFRFADDAAGVRPAARLRYRIEGYDSSWHDLPAKVRVLVQFFDSAGQTIGSDEFSMEGQTPGWRGSAETSDFVSRREQTVAPARSARMRIAFLSTGEDATVGIIGIDAVRITVHSPSAGRAQTFDCGITPGTNLSDPLGTPINWIREGTRAELAQLRTRPTPEPHRILVIEDDDNQRFGNWALNPASAVPVMPGDQVTVEWQAAYTLGCSGTGEARYQNLSPGNYWFRVAAVKPNGDPTGAEVSLPIIVTVPPYRRVEFWIVVAAMTVALAAWTGRIIARGRMQQRLRELKREQALEHERARIARDLHDEVGAGLTAIAMQSDWVRRELADSALPEARRRIQSVCQIAVELTRSVDEIVWAVNPANDTLERFVNYLTQYSEQFADATGLKMRFDIPRELPDTTLTGARRHLLFLAVLEALNNSAKHANGGLLKLGVQISPHLFSITVEDDGRGFVVGSDAGGVAGNGIQNMRSRMEQLGGHFFISSEPGLGTRVKFSIDPGETPRPRRRP